MSSIPYLAATPALSASGQTTTSVSSTSALPAYKADLRQRMNSVWLRLASSHAGDLSPGTAKVAFHILPDGTVRNLQITSNTGNTALARVALQTVRTTRLLPLPSSLLPPFRTGICLRMTLPSRYIQDESAERI
jgi:TonB family protein